jgi:hypothetical protein
MSIWGFLVVAFELAVGRLFVALHSAVNSALCENRHDLWHAAPSPPVPEPAFHGQAGYCGCNLCCQPCADVCVQAAAMGGKPVVVLLLHGGPLDVSPLLGVPHVEACLTAWYPGQVRQA